MAARVHQQLNERLQSQLEDLISQSQFLLDAQAAVAASQFQVAELQARTSELLFQQNRARQQVRAQQVGRQLAVQPSTKAAQMEVAPGEAQRVVSLEAVQQDVAARQLHHAHMAYRIAGRTFSRFSDKEVQIQLETFYKNRFCESYFIVCEYTGGRFVPRKHTLPHFIPLDSIVTAQGDDLEATMQAIQDHLIAFVARREQASELRKMGAVVQTSDAFDIFHVEMASLDLEVKALFSLSRMYPTETRFLRSGSRIPSAEEKSQTNYLSDVVAELIRSR